MNSVYKKKMEHTDLDMGFLLNLYGKQYFGHTTIP